MGIYPMRKAPPGAREKSALTEEHTKQEELSCPNCGEELPDEAANFCPKCGTELLDETAKFCSNCGEELPDEAVSFCPKCGAEQQDQAATNEEPTQPSSDEEQPTRRGPEGPSRGPEGPTRQVGHLGGLADLLVGLRGLPVDQAGPPEGAEDDGPRKA